MSLKAKTISARAKSDARQHLREGVHQSTDGKASVAFYWFLEPDYEQKKSAWARTYAAAYNRVMKQSRRNPSNWKSGKWIKASAVRVRKVAGRVVMDIKKAI